MALRLSSCLSSGLPSCFAAAKVAAGKSRRKIKRRCKSDYRAEVTKGDVGLEFKNSKITF